MNQVFVLTARSLARIPNVSIGSGHTVPQASVGNVLAASRVRDDAVSLVEHVDVPVVGVEES